MVKQCVRVPVFVMIRPRGGDFLYSDREVEVMKADIRLAKLHGADGLVFGALTEDGRIDTELCTALLGKSVCSGKCCAELCAVAGCRRTVLLRPVLWKELRRVLGSASLDCGLAASLHLLQFQVWSYLWDTK